jgi:hypothetical protein
MPAQAWNVGRFIKTFGWSGREEVVGTPNALTSSIDIRLGGV